MALTLQDDRRIIVPPPIASASALGRFGNYKKEEPADVRHAVVSGSTPDDLRAKRDMLRSMTPEQAMSVIEFHKDLTVFEALVLAKKEGKLIVPNYVHDRILTETNSEDYRLADYLVRAGTMVIYAAPGKPFGEKVVYGEELEDVSFSISFDIPVRFRNKKNCALIVEHPDFDLTSSGKNAYMLIADESRLHLHERFPKKNGNYSFDERFRLPVGRVEKTSEAWRQLRRLDHGYIGLLVRDGGWTVLVRRGVDAGLGASYMLGVALF